MHAANLDAVWSKHIGVLNIELHRAGCRGFREPASVNLDFANPSINDRWESLGMVFFRIQFFQFSLLRQMTTFGKEYSLERFLPLKVIMLKPIAFLLFWTLVFQEASSGPLLLLLRRWGIVVQG